MAANVDTTRVIDQLEIVLLAGLDRERCQEALDILRRWQWDGDLDATSRQRAAALVRQYSWRRYAA